MNESMLHLVAGRDASYVVGDKTQSHHSHRLYGRTQGYNVKIVHQVGAVKVVQMGHTLENVDGTTHKNDLHLFTQMTTIH